MKPDALAANYFCCSLTGMMGANTEATHLTLPPMMVLEDLPEDTMKLTAFAFLRLSSKVALSARRHLAFGPGWTKPTVGSIGSIVLSVDICPGLLVKNSATLNVRNLAVDSVGYSLGQSRALTDGTVQGRRGYRPANLHANDRTFRARLLPSALQPSRYDDGQTGKIREVAMTAGELEGYWRR